MRPPESILFDESRNTLHDGGNNVSGVDSGGRRETFASGFARHDRHRQTAGSDRRVTGAGLTGDTIVDEKNHGGPDQAVYVYTTQDYGFWEAELGRDLHRGLFGENLTIDGVSSADVAVGDRFRIGADCELEAAAARIPCAVFQHQMGEVDWVRRFREGRRPGVYCRVITPGEVSTGDMVEHVAGASGVTILDTQDLYYDRNAARADLERALLAPIAARTRAHIEGRLLRTA